MRIRCIRDDLTARSTLSRVDVPGLARTFFILERPKFFDGKENVAEKTCVLPGIYPIRLMYSEHNKLWVPLLAGTPGRDLVEIHPANWPHQLRGCLAPGLERAKDSVGRSREAFFAIRACIVDALMREELVDIEITEDN